MKDYTFKVPQDIVFGVGSLKRLPELLEKSGSKKMMVVSDRGLEKLGVVQKVLDIVEAEGIETVSFSINLLRNRIGKGILCSCSEELINKRIEDLKKLIIEKN